MGYKFREAYSIPAKVLARSADNVKTSRKDF
jgi:hypothetical protein